MAVSKIRNVTLPSIAVGRIGPNVRALGDLRDRLRGPGTFIPRLLLSAARHGGEVGTRLFMPVFTRFPTDVARNPFPKCENPHTIEHRMNVRLIYLLHAVSEGRKGYSSSWNHS